MNNYSIDAFIRNLQTRKYGAYRNLKSNNDINFNGLYEFVNKRITLLQYAIIYNNTRAVRFLSKKTCKSQDSNNMTTLMYCAKMRCPMFKRFLYQRNMSDDDNCTALMYAADNNNIDMIIHLKSELGEVDISGRCALSYAIRRGYLHIAVLLKAESPYLNNDDYNSLNTLTNLKDSQPSAPSVYTMVTKDKYIRRQL